MQHCDIILNFDIENFEILKSKFNLKNTIFYTPDLLVYKKIKQLNYDVKHLLLGTNIFNSEIYDRYEYAANQTILIQNSLDTVKYKDVKIIDALKLDIFDVVLNLKQIKTILEEEAKNIIFLFPDQKYFYFAIYEISKNLNYNSQFKVSKIIDTDLISLDFNDIFASDLVPRIESPHEISSMSNLDFISLINKFLENIEFSKHGFFFETSGNDFYSKPVYPVLSKFNETNTPHTLFSWDDRTTKCLKSHGYDSFNLYYLKQNCNSNFFLENHKKIFSNFFKNICDLQKTSNDIILNSFLNFLKNDRIISDLIDIMISVEILNVIIEKFHFKSLLVSMDGSVSNTIVCAVAANHNILTYSIVPEILSFHATFKILYNASKLFLSGSEMKNGLKNLGLDEKRLIITGNPKFDYVKHNSILENTQNKIITVANSRIHHNDEEWIIELIKYCNNNKIDVILKFHPMYAGNSSEALMVHEKILKIKKSCDSLNYKIIFNSNLSELLHNTSILITDYSAVGIEASLNNLPIITVNMSGENYENFPIKFYEKGISLHAETNEQLTKNIEMIFTNNETKNKLNESRLKFNYESNYFNDGNASTRIFSFLTNFFSGSVKS